MLSMGSLSLVLVACVIPPPVASMDVPAQSLQVHDWAARLADRDPLFAAVESGQNQQVQVVLAEGGEVHARDFGGNTLLHEAARADVRDDRGHVSMHCSATSKIWGLLCCVSE